MPPGGDGFYYFSVFFLVAPGELAYFEIRINGEALCTAETDQTETTANQGQAGCSAASYAMEGWFSCFFLHLDKIIVCFYVMLLFLQQVTRSRLYIEEVVIRPHCMRIQVTTGMASPDSESETFSTITCSIILCQIKKACI